MPVSGLPQVQLNLNQMLNIKKEQNIGFIDPVGNFILTL